MELLHLDIVQLKKEADLRYELIRVREHAEEVALLRGEASEHGRLLQRLHNEFPGIAQPMPDDGEDRGQLMPMVWRIQTQGTSCRRSLL